MVDTAGKNYFPARGQRILSKIPSANWHWFWLNPGKQERAAKQLAQVLDPEGIVLSLQNGLGNLEILGEILGKVGQPRG